MRELDEMVLRGPHGSLRLSIIGYQCPTIQDDKWDSNWLIVAGHASLDGKEWTFRDACLTTFEAQRFAEWLDQTARGETDEGAGFVEPNIQLDRVSPSSIRISLALESAPPWAVPNDEWDQYGFEVPVGPELAVAAGTLRQQLKRFPMRGQSDG